MAQATGVESWSDAKIEYSDNGGTWTDMSGYANSVTKSGGDRLTGEAYTFDGDVAIIGTGKRQPVELTIRVAYTETDTHPYTIIRTSYEAKTRFQVRVWPEGGQLGEIGFYTDNDSRITSDPRPVGEAGSADPIFFEFTVRTSQLQDVTGT